MWQDLVKYWYINQNKCSKDSFQLVLKCSSCVSLCSVNYKLMMVNYVRRIELLIDKKSINNKSKHRQYKFHEVQNCSHSNLQINFDFIASITRYRDKKCKIFKDFFGNLWNLLANQPWLSRGKIHFFFLNFFLIFFS